MTTKTTYHPADLPTEHPRRVMRDLSREAFIEQHGSGTLQKSARLGINVDEAYLQERVQVEFGIGFEITKRSWVVYTDLMLEPCQAMTELGWHAERMIELRPFESDVFLCKEFVVQNANGASRRGAGIWVKETSAPWLPAGHMVFAMLTERTDKGYGPARNPF